MIRRNAIIISGLTLFLCISGPATAATIYVDASQDGSSGTPDGSTWALAYKYLQDGLSDAISGDTIRVAQGVYHPDDDDNIPSSTHATGDRDASFVMLDGVVIEGGYKGIAGISTSTADDRDDFSDLYNPQFETILSGDLMDNDAFMSIGDTLTDTSRDENSKSVVNGGNLTGLDTILDGVTVRDGDGGSVSTNPNVPVNFVFGGAGIFVRNLTSPSFQNLRIIRNWVSPINNTSMINEGGGMFLDGDIESVIENCLILDNEANKGGGMSIHFDAAPTIRFCIYDRNTASNIGGGGLFMKDDARPRVEDTLFIENDAPNGVLGVTHGGGGTLVCARSEPTFRRCRWESNSVTGSNGGGLTAFDASPVQLIDSEFTGNVITDSGNVDRVNGAAISLENIPEVAKSLITNCTIWDNHSVGAEFSLASAGGLYTTESVDVVNTLFFDNTADYGAAILTEGAASPLVVNCTVVENESATLAGGIQTIGSSSCTVKNTILWGNVDPTSGVQAEQICDAGSLTGPCSATPTTFTVTFSDIEDGTIGTTPFPFGGSANGNIDLDPEFEDAASDDFRLTDISPCVDRGDTPIPNDLGDVDEDSVTTGEQTPLDRALNDRFVFAGNTGIDQTECVVDMGAFEYEFSFICDLDVFGDLNDDTLRNGLDIQPFVECILTTPVADQACICARGDFRDLDGVTIGDIAPFVACILSGGTDCDAQYCPAEGGGPRGPLPDCNDNSVPDDTDIGQGTSQDCNGNGIPDECDIDVTDPDGNELVSADVNSNDVPDECDPDCDGDGTPDDKTIADCTTDPDCADCDENGVPDGCDEDCDDDGTPDACETMIDCNSNDIFDACEYDCDGDGVPDDCELSGNDCNENLSPDDCEIDFPPPFNLPDCNDNGIPDSCDIADCDSDPDCGDCNENGIPDECDIANEISEDTDENGIPDECETESMMGGGESSSSSELTEAEKWDAYMTWCFATDFSSMTNGQKFSAALNKRLELGLPAGQLLPD